MNNIEQAKFVAENLAATSPSQKIHHKLILIAEDIHFPTPELRQQICKTLLSTAITLSKNSDPAIKEIVFSAIRKLSALTEPRKITKLIRLLQPTQHIDTKLITLQGIVKIFELAPPNKDISYTPLSNRIFEIISKLIDPDVFIAGEISAICTNAIIVMCILGDNRAKKCIKCALALKKPWVIDKLLKQLENIRQNWFWRGNDEIRNNKSYKNIVYAIDTLNKYNNLSNMFTD